jgi:hypothetical protein
MVCSGCDMAKRGKKTKFTKAQVSDAAAVLGATSWQARVEQVGLAQLRERLSRAGKLGGRPRGRKDG